MIPQIIDKLAPVSGPVAIQAGHFLLVPTGGGCGATAVSEADRATLGGTVALQGWSKFSMLTWKLGVLLASALRTEGQRAQLLILANDWQLLRARETQDATSIRAEFYRSHSHLFPEYLSVLKAEEYEVKDIVKLGEWHPYISEYWLRRRIERRLKRMAGTDGADGLRASNGKSSVVFDDFGTELRLLHCGQADCAGEVMEMVVMLHGMGFRHLVNFVPSECEAPVNEGVRRALCVFRIDSLTAINVAVPCDSPTSQPHETFSLRATRVWGERDGTGPVEGLTQAFFIPAKVGQA